LPRLLVAAASRSVNEPPARASSFGRLRYGRLLSRNHHIGRDRQAHETARSRFAIGKGRRAGLPGGTVASAGGRTSIGRRAPLDSR